MKKIRNYISILFCFLTVQLIGQNECAFIEANFDSISLNKSYSIEVNGIDISQSNKVYKIPIKTFGYDTIRYTLNRKTDDWAIMKLRSNTQYEIRSNSCSFYTIKPKINPKQGMVQFIIKSKSTINYLVGIDGFDRTINRNSIDEFYYTPPSAMCPYSAKPIEINSIKGETLKRVRFHFLHGELVGVKYNEEVDSLELNLYGHIRDEDDYRYYNQKNE